MNKIDRCSDLGKFNGGTFSKLLTSAFFVIDSRFLRYLFSIIGYFDTSSATVPSSNIEQILRKAFITCKKQSNEKGAKMRFTNGWVDKLSGKRAGV